LKSEKRRREPTLGGNEEGAANLIHTNHQGDCRFSAEADGAEGKSGIQLVVQTRRGSRFERNGHDREEGEGNPTEWRGMSLFRRSCAPVPSGLVNELRDTNGKK